MSTKQISGPEPESEPTRSLWVGNLPRQVVQADLKKILIKSFTFNDVLPRVILRRSNRGQKLPYAFVNFTELSDALYAFEQTDGKLTISERPVVIHFQSQATTQVIISGFPYWWICSNVNFFLRTNFHNHFKGLELLLDKIGQRYCLIDYESAKEASKAAKVIQGTSVIGSLTMVARIFDSSIENGKFTVSEKMNTKHLAKEPRPITSPAGQFSDPRLKNSGMQINKDHQMEQKQANILQKQSLQHQQKKQEQQQQQQQILVNANMPYTSINLEEQKKKLQLQQLQLQRSIQQRKQHLKNSLSISVPNGGGSASPLVDMHRSIQNPIGLPPPSSSHHSSPPAMIKLGNQYGFNESSPMNQSPRMLHSSPHIATRSPRVLTNTLFMPSSANNTPQHQHRNIQQQYQNVDSPIGSVPNVIMEENASQMNTNENNMNENNKRRMKRSIEEHEEILLTRSVSPPIPSRIHTAPGAPGMTLSAISTDPPQPPRSLNIYRLKQSADSDRLQMPLSEPTYPTTRRQKTINFDSHHTYCSSPQQSSNQYSLRSKVVLGRNTDSGSSGNNSTNSSPGLLTRNFSSANNDTNGRNEPASDSSAAGIGPVLLPKRSRTPIMNHFMQFDSCIVSNSSNNSGPVNVLGYPDFSRKTKAPVTGTRTLPKPPLPTPTSNQQQQQQQQRKTVQTMGVNFLESQIPSLTGVTPKSCPKEGVKEFCKIQFEGSYSWINSDSAFDKIKMVLSTCLTSQHYFVQGTYSDTNESFLRVFILEEFHMLGLFIHRLSNNTFSLGYLIKCQLPNSQVMEACQRFLTVIGTSVNDPEWNVTILRIELDFNSDEDLTIVGFSDILMDCLDILARRTIQGNSRMKEICFLIDSFSSPKRVGMIVAEIEKYESQIIQIMRNVFRPNEIKPFDVLSMTVIASFFLQAFPTAAKLFAKAFNTRNVPRTLKERIPGIMHLYLGNAAEMDMHIRRELDDAHQRNELTFVKILDYLRISTAVSIIERLLKETIFNEDLMNRMQLQQVQMSSTKPTIVQSPLVSNNSIINPVATNNNSNSSTNNNNSGIVSPMANLGTMSLPNPPNFLMRSQLNCSPFTHSRAVTPQDVGDIDSLIGSPFAATQTPFSPNENQTWFSPASQLYRRPSNIKFPNNPAATPTSNSGFPGSPIGHSSRGRVPSFKAYVQQNSTNTNTNTTSNATTGGLVLSSSAENCGVVGGNISQPNKNTANLKRNNGNLEAYGTSMESLQAMFNHSTLSPQTVPNHSHRNLFSNSGNSTMGSGEGNAMSGQQQN